MDNLTNALLSLPMFRGKKYRLSSIALLVLRIICALLILAVIFGIIVTVTPKQEAITNSVFSFEATPDVTYKVNLRPNEFFEEETLGMNKNYIRPLVASIDMSFTDICKYTGNGKVDYKYKVRGKASTWYVRSNDEKELWEHEDIITSTDYMPLSSSDCTLTIPVSVDQSYYAKQFENFQDQLGISANGYYDIICEVDFRCNSKGLQKYENIKSTLSIPLNGKVFTPEASVPKNPVAVPYDEVEINTLPTNWVLFAILVAVALILIFCLVLFMLCFEPETRDMYLEELRTKISSVEDRIAYVRSDCEFTEDDIEINDFDSVVRLADERALPIFCARDDIERNAAFFVTENTQKFYYIFSDKGYAESEDEEEEE